MTCMDKKVWIGGDRKNVRERKNRTGAVKSSNSALEP